MPLFSCPVCTQKIDAEEAWIGAQVACPTCGSAIEVPDVSPYQAPAAARDPFATYTERSAPEDSIGAKEKKSLWKWPLTGLLVAAGISVVQYSVKPPNPLDALLGNDGLAGMIAQCLGFTIAAAIGALVVALIAAGIAKLCQRSFKRALSSAFSVGVVALVLLSTLGTIVTPARTRAKSPSATQAEVRQARETMG